jgi:hypothetical protein
MVWLPGQDVERIPRIPTAGSTAVRLSSVRRSSPVRIATVPLRALTLLKTTERLDDHTLVALYVQKICRVQNRLLSRNTQR